MKKIELVVEEIRENRIICDASEFEIDDKIYDIFLKKIRIIAFFTGTSFSARLKPNESRYTILTAIKEYQKSILPDNFILMDANNFDEDIYISEVGEQEFKFYDAKTRVMTVLII